ncbi:MAG TPA: ribosome-associated translation inhibitor RaiA [Candidatus Pristimantibacillus sp.]|jgi:putative sigma-54 modulation protein|nr:ribosome-associated translation inhibitor RaiA [Candidatus Pristimantibacillus sp.]
MIKRIDIDGVHMEVGDDLRKYVTNKIGKLEKYVPRFARGSVHAEVKLKEGKLKAREQRTCEVILHLPHDIITVSETTINMFAAVDIVEQKLKNQLHKYKEKHSGPKLRQRLMSRLKRQSLLA